MDPNAWKHKRLKEHVHIANGAGVIKALTALRKGSQAFAAIPGWQRRELRGYLLQVSIYDSLWSVGEAGGGFSGLPHLADLNPPQSWHHIHGSFQGIKQWLLTRSQ